MMLMVGAAIDYGYALNINQRLNEAADTAVLSAISPSIAQGAGSYSIAYANGNMRTVAQNTFKTNTSALPISVLPIVTPTKNTSGANIATYTVTLTYSASVPTFFAGLVGIPSIPISGHAQATTSPLTFIRYYILIDISQSMGIAATAAEMQSLFLRIEQYGQGTGGEVGCVFGCHVTAPLTSGGGLQAYPNEAYAHNLSPYISLRIDSANTAIDDIIGTAISDENPTTPNISMGLYTMTGYPSATITPVFPTNQTIPTSTNQATWQATTNLSPWASVAVDLGNNNSGGQGDSDLTDELQNFATYLPAQGTGASASSPLNYVFLITDGVVDVPGSCTSGHCTAALQPSACSALQQKATVGVIYTTYLPIYADPSNANNNATTGPFEGNYQSLVLPFVNQIAPNLQSCASSSNYYLQASYGPDIIAAMQSLFANSLQTVKLTQ
jgi:Flp pilus assembly protein TadG